MSIFVAPLRKFHATNFLRVILCLALVLATLPLRGKAQASNSANAQPDNGYKTATLPSRNLPKIDDLLRENGPDVKKEKVKSPKLDSATRCRPYDMRCLKFWQDKGKPNDAKIGQLPPPRPSDNAFAQLLAANDVLAATRHAWQNVSDVPFGLNLMRPAPKVAAAAAPMMMQSNWPVYSNLYTELAQRRNQQGTGGEDLYSGNYNWSLPIVGLPGRAGHDLGLTLSYNSHVWVRTDTGMRMLDYVDWYTEPGFGFSVGLPRLNSFQHAARGSSVVNAFLFTLSSGRAIELIRKSNSASLGVFESMDGSLIRMIIEYGPNKQHVFFPDGTKLEYQNFQCQTIRDRNGNQLTVTYHATYGLMTKITDTLGREITFHYQDQFGIDIDQPRQYQGYFSLSHIKQWRKNETGGDVQVTLANFGYENITIYTNFQGLLSEVPNGTVLPMCTKVVLADGSLYKFAYTTYGQVKTISHYAPKVTNPDQNNLCPQTETANCHYRLLSTINYNLPNGMTTDPQQPDCPRFTTRTDWAFEWNSGVTTQFSYGSGNAWGQATAPDNTKLRQFFYVSTSSADLWQDGLPTQTKAYSDTQDPNNVNTVPKRTTSMTWEYNTSYGPRPLSAAITDGEINSNRYTSFVYPATFSYNLPIEVYEYNGTNSSGTLLSKTTATYLLSSPYVVNSGGISGLRRIIGLPSERKQYDGANTLLSKVTYQYDQTGYLEHQLPAAGSIVNFDSAFASLTYTGRGNVTSVKRWDATAETSEANAITTSTRYNTTGSVIGQVLPPNNQSGVRETRIFYTDVFSDNASANNTLAYPTKIVDPDAYALNQTSPAAYSSLKYRYDIGAVTYTQDPKMLATAPTTWIVKTYDEVGRLKRVDNQVNNGYTRYTYDTAFHYTQVFSKTDAPSYTVPGVGGTGSVLVTERFVTTLYDGHGRTRANVTPHPGSVGGLSSTYQVYDVMGRVVQASNPTEVDVNWNPTGDDAGVYRWTLQTYDWKGRPWVTTNQDGTTRSVAYNGCGCTGSETITTTDEVNRQQRITRNAYLDGTTKVDKAEILNTDGTTYSTTVSRYKSNERKHYVWEFQGPTAAYGACPTGTCQETWTQMDGHGRTASRHRPIETGATSYLYYADDSVQRMTDPRGAFADYAYNKRGLVTSVNYNEAGVAQATPDLTFEYDTAGNRTKMIESTVGQLEYSYDTLSRLQWEERTFTGGPSGLFRLSYTYNLAGQMKSLTDVRYNTTVSYDRDLAERLLAVNGTGYSDNGQAVPQFAFGTKYRAWNGLKEMSYNNNLKMTMGYNSRLLATDYTVKKISDQFTVAGSTYQYYNDGRTSFASDVINNKFDRSYTWDHAGRLEHAKTGAEARGGTATDGPYRQTYNYDVWGNLTSRDYRLWTKQLPDTATYTNNRRQYFNYDNAGNVTFDPTSPLFGKYFSYDVVNRNTVFTAGRVGGGQTGHDTMPDREITQQYDGAGIPLKRVEIQRIETYVNGGPQTNISTTTTTTYYLRSSVMGGTVVTEIDAQANKTKGYIDVQGIRLAEQRQLPTNSFIEWRQTNPVTSNWLETLPSGDAFKKAEHDPFGAEVGTHNFYLDDPEPTYPEIKQGEPLYIEGGDPFDRSGGYEIDGLPVSASEFFRRAGSDTLMAVTKYGLYDVGKFIGTVIGYNYERPTWDKDEGNYKLAYDFGFMNAQKPTQAPKTKIDELDPIILDAVVAAAIRFFEKPECFQLLSNPARKGVKGNALFKLGQIAAGGRIKFADLNENVDTSKGRTDGSYHYGEDSIKIDIDLREWIGIHSVDGITPEDYLLETLLHEIGHSTGAFSHDDTVGYLRGLSLLLDEGIDAYDGFNIYSQEKISALIREKCGIRRKD